MSHVPQKDLKGRISPDVLSPNCMLACAIAIQDRARFTRCTGRGKQFTDKVVGSWICIGQIEDRLLIVPGIVQEHMLPDGPLIGHSTCYVIEKACDYQVLFELADIVLTRRIQTQIILIESASAAEAVS